MPIATSSGSRPVEDSSVTQVTAGHNPGAGERDGAPSISTAIGLLFQSSRARTRPPVDYRLAPTTTARFVGLAVVGLAVRDVRRYGGGRDRRAEPGRSCWSCCVVGLAGVFTLGWYLRSRGWVLRCTDDGYRVRMVRGAGVTEARWADVEDAVTTTRHDVACVVLRLRDGGTTTIPVGVLAVDKEQFVRELQARLQRASGLRPWRGRERPPPADSAGDARRLVACPALSRRRRLVRSMAPAC